MNAFLNHTVIHIYIHLTHTITHPHPHTHTAPIRFEQELEKEVVRFINTESLPITLECEISGNPLPSLSFLHNNNPITTNTQLVTIETQEPNCR